MNIPVDPSTVYLFLDFDGVLHHHFPVHGQSDADNAHFAFLPGFEEAIRACKQNLRIVITSTWRAKTPLSKLREFFAPDIASLIIDTTPRIGTGNGPGGRLAEVNAWLENNGLADALWVGIDDHAVLYGPGVAVVACDDRFGRRERQLLLEAVRDPRAYARNHPVPPNDNEIKIITSVKPR